jgi:DNA/RNA endonuclease YhcR with UshA esterase domain
LVFGVVALACGLARGQEAATQPVKLDPADKAAVAEAKGKDVVVEGVVERAAWSNTGKVLRASFGKDALAVIVFDRDRKAIDEAFGGDVAKALDGAKVRVTGKVDEFRGRAEIKVTQPSQLKVLEAAKEKPAAAAGEAKGSAKEAEPTER